MVTLVDIVPVMVSRIRMSPTGTVAVAVPLLVIVMVQLTCPPLATVVGVHDLLAVRSGAVAAKVPLLVTTMLQLTVLPTPTVLPDAGVQLLVVARSGWPTCGGADAVLLPQVSAMPLGVPQFGFTVAWLVVVTPVVGAVALK